MVMLYGWLNGWIPFLSFVTMDAQAIAKLHSCGVFFHQRNAVSNHWMCFYQGSRNFNRIQW